MAWVWSEGEASACRGPTAKACTANVHEWLGVVVVPLGSRPVRVGSSSNDQIRIRAETVVPRRAVIELIDGKPVVTADRGTVAVNELKITSRSIGHRDFVSLGEADLLIFGPEGL